MQPQRNLMIQLFALKKLLDGNYPSLKAQKEIMISGICSAHNIMKICLSDYKKFGEEIRQYPELQQAVSFIENLGLRNLADANYAIRTVLPRCRKELEENNWHSTTGYVLQKDNAFIPSYYAGHSADMYDRLGWTRRLDDACLYFNKQDIDEAMRCAKLDNIVTVEAVSLPAIKNEYVAVLEDWANTRYALNYD